MLKNNKYYKYKKSSQGIDVYYKLRFDLALSEGEFYFVTVRVINCVPSHPPSLPDLPLSVYTKDKNGIYLSANKFTASLTRFKSIEGMSHFDIFGRDAQLLSENDMTTIKNKKDIFYEKIKNDTFLSLKFCSEEQHIGAVCINLNHIHEQDFKKNFLNASSPDIDITLTKTELICLNYLTNGQTAKEIAREMLISPRTVEFHLSNAKTKLNCFKITKIAHTIGRYHSLFKV
ncbi:hypothetical protein IB678_03255 [Francisella adeliensis]|nr:hypothetical protein [Francisella adeliensis]MBK2096510.1 hypothetical protein [Francisella adeliensis]QIW12996.1 LuxR family transcriptional regulator [Francisella adeliensis]QIW14872.1 LuxR family transcriptional regulator [Francisella adeliensis]